MSKNRISIDASDGSSHLSDFCGVLSANDSESLESISHYIAAIASGAIPSKVRINYGAAQAAGTITFSSFADADTVTLNSIVLTGKTSPSGASQWGIGATDEACANALAIKINASALDLIVGCIAASRRATLLLASVVDGNTVTINGVVFTAKNTPDDAVREQFAVGATDAITAQNLLNAIGRSLNGLISGISGTRSSATLTLNFNGSLVISASGTVTVTSTIVVITSIIPGQIGNLCTLAISAHGSVVAPTGGLEGTEIIFAKNYSTL